MNRDELIKAVADALADLQGAYDDRDRALANRLGIGRTDLRCLDLIVRHGPQTAAQLGTQLHLTRGSMTSLVNRLEKAGYATRRPDPSHGKRKLITPTQRLARAIGPAIAAHQAAGVRDLDGYTNAELRLIARFLQQTLAHQADPSAHT